MDENLHCGPPTPHKIIHPLSRPRTHSKAPKMVTFFVNLFLRLELSNFW